MGEVTVASGANVHAHTHKHAHTHTHARTHTHLCSLCVLFIYIDDGVPYEVVVVAFTSAGRGEENDVRGGPFFTRQLSPTKAVENLAVIQLEGTTSGKVALK